MRYKLTKEDIAKGKPVTVYEDKYVRISKIPLNYKIDIKSTLVMQNPMQQLERDWYEDSEQTLEFAKKTAERIVREYWRPKTKADLEREARLSKYHFIPRGGVGKDAR